MALGWGGNAYGQCNVPAGITNALMVAAGYAYNLGLLNNGTVVGWGSDSVDGYVPTNLLKNVTMVAAGWDHNVVLLTNGTVQAWGDNFFGEINVPAGLTNVTVISANGLHTLALRTNGTVVAWGDDYYHESDVPPALTNVTAIAAGGEHSLAVSNGFVVAWGYNNYSQCNVPAGLSNVWDVAASGYHSLALLKNGTVVAWGDNTYGESSVPPGLTNVVAIAAGGDALINDPYLGSALPYSLALENNGSVVAWGAGNVLTTVAGLNNVISLGGGLYHAVAIRTGPPTPLVTLQPVDQYQITNGVATFTVRGAGLYGVGYQWQTNGVNVAGATNTTLSVSNTAAAGTQSFDAVVTDNGGMGSVVSSNAHLYFVTPPVITSALPAPNQVVTYQSNLVMSVVATAPGITNGFPLSYQWQFNGTNIAGATGASYTLHAKGTSYGTYSVLVSNAAGSVSTNWQLSVYYPGILITIQPTNQYQIAGVSITFTGNAVASNSIAYQWSFNGTNIAGATNASLTLNNVQAAQQGYYHFTANDGVGILTSSNAYFYLVNPPLITSLTLPTNMVVLSQSSVSLAVTVATFYQTNGFPLSYKWQFNGTNIPGFTSTNYPFIATNSGIYSIIITNAAGSTNASWQINVVNPGNIWGWGDNEYGESTLPSGLSNAVSIAAGEYHSVAAEDNGSVVQWGYNWGNVPADLTNAVAVAAGYDHSIALRSNGTVETWGTNTAYANYVPSGISGVKAVAAGWDDNLVLFTNGTVAAWGLDGNIFGWGDLLDIPSGLTNITAISAESLHALALESNGTVVGWGDNEEGESSIPAGLTNVVAVAAGGQHSLALLNNGTVVAWGWNNYGQCNVPVGLSNVMAIAAGWAHSVALKNDGTVVTWGDNSDGQTNTPTLSQIKLIAAGGYFTLANFFSPTVMYPVDVTKDLLLIYNTNSVNSTFVLNYYLANRPLISGVNVLGIGCSNVETVPPNYFTNVFIPQVQAWTTNNPTKRPQYVILFYDLPSRVNTNNVEGDPSITTWPSVQYQLATACIAGWNPFVTSINMASTNDCIAYINKLHSIGTNYSPGKLLISASTGGYCNTNFVVDDVHNVYCGDNTAAVATNGLAAAGVPSAAVLYLYGCEESGNLPHLTNAVNVAGYITWGSHSSLTANYPYDGEVEWRGNSGWWIMESIESFNGQRLATGQGNFVKWFTANSFGGTNYQYTPVGGVSHTDEPNLPGVNDSAKYFGLWASGKNLAICAWASRRTSHFQALGDPFITK